MATKHKEIDVKRYRVYLALETAYHSLSAVYFEMLRIDSDASIKAHDAVGNALGPLYQELEEAGFFVLGQAESEDE